MAERACVRLELAGGVRVGDLGGTGEGLAISTALERSVTRATPTLHIQRPISPNLPGGWKGLMANNAFIQLILKAYGGCSAKTSVV